MKLSLISDQERQHVGSDATPAVRHMKDLPGPRPLPLLGNALQVRLNRMHQDMEKWSGQYGPMFQVHLGREPVLVLSDHSVIAGVLRDRPESFRRPSRMQEIISEMGIADGVFVAEGEHWARQRRMIMASFAPGHVRAYFPALLNVAGRLKRRWLIASDISRPVDLQSDLMRFTVDVISGLAFGVDVNTLSSNDDVIQQHLDKVLPTVWRRTHAIVPYWRLFKLPRDRAMERSVGEVNKAIRDFMAQARERLKDPARRAAPQNLLEAMIVAADQPDSGMTDEDVVGNVFTMLLAGEDTTATSISWMLYLLSRNPKAMERVRDEVDQVLGKPMETWTPEDMGRLDYLEACIHESMRIKPVGPFNVVETLRDVEIQGVLVPKGTSVVGLMRQDGMNDELFPDAGRFMPERWLPGEGAGMQADHAKRVSMPFGAGPRICPGRYLAIMEIKLAVAMLFQHFGIVALDTPDGNEAQEHMSFTMTPVGLSMTIRERKHGPAVRQASAA
ncbi:MAG: cytochrome P450 [Aquabacterium sp.]